MVRQLRKMHRPFKFAGVGTFMTLLNGLILWALVSGLGMFPVLANLARTPCTTQLHFYLHRRFTWKGNHATTLWQQWYRFHVLKVGSMALSQLCFLVLTVWMSTP